MISGMPHPSASYPLKVEKLAVYPVKSLGGISMTACYARKAGFNLDRRWMLIDESNSFLTQRSWSGLALFALTLENDEIQVHFDKSSISFSPEEDWGQLIETNVWDDIAVTREVNPVVSEWFSEQILRKVRLVKLAHEDARMHTSSILKGEIPVSLADSYPYLVIGTESLNNLNSQLENKIDMDRFRPNIVVSTQLAHEEDGWQTFRIGEAQFRFVKPCGRCNVITIDQTSGKKDNEPLTTLSNYRKKDHSVLFGSHLICMMEGLVKVGDEVCF